MRTLIILTLLSVGTSSVPAIAQTGFDPRIIVFGDEREKIENTPIEQRPNRPLHFYGNTVRRRRYRTVSQPSRSRSSQRPVNLDQVEQLALASECETQLRFQLQYIDSDSADGCRAQIGDRFAFETTHR